MPDEKGNYIYMAPNQEKSYPNRYFGKEKTIPLSYRGFTSFEFSHHLGVIKTRHGYASGIAIDIDNRASSIIAGTIAGEDTILLIPREGVSRQEIVDTLMRIIPGMKNGNGESGTKE